jgi:hypothetical protein
MLADAFPRNRRGERAMVSLARIAFRPGCCVACALLQAPALLFGCGIASLDEISPTARAGTLGVCLRMQTGAASAARKEGLSFHD